ncbi:MAG TPA: LLM class flavin-dependent oxidoreductase [Acidimicrobiales bacterium]|jgi:alkanesulfonate monooxygenase SsuD/methylene tetrahydromethanopterin reductase-like flavin-dependent oxidoreductase (luciferase family)|nr:LLM class flavin-dependent oxidoreductase [Acidimicrobiales bacterium]
MKLDLLYEFQPKIKPWDKPHPYGQRQAEQAAYDEAIAEIQFADTLGFQTVWCVEHHFRDGRSACPSNEVVLGGLALTTQNLRLGFGVSLMPPGFQHPARVAEKVATVDVLSHGRVEWGTGRSTPMEQIAFGVPADDRSRAQWREAVDFVVKAWEQERISWDSDLIKMPERVQTPKPYQDPHPPAWLAAASEKSAETAGRFGLGLLSFALLQPVEMMAKTIDVYRNAQADAAEPITRVKNDRAGAYTLVHCTDDLDEAAAYGLWDSVRWWYKHLAEFTLEWELPNLSKEEQEAVFPLLKPSIEGNIDVNRYTDEDMIIVGTPDECLEKILRYEEAGVDQLLCYVQFGTLPHEKVMRTIELLGTKVIPQLESRGHRVDYQALLG